LIIICDILDLNGFGKFFLKGEDIMIIYTVQPVVLNKETTGGVVLLLLK